MKASTNHRRFAKRLTAVSVGLALVASGAIGAESFAGDDDNTGDLPAPPPGEPFIPTPSPGGDADAPLGSDELIQTSGSTFDETILSKYIPASGFDPFEAGGFDSDAVDFNGGSCFSVDPAATGVKTRMWAPVELPDGSRIKRVTFFGEDSYAPVGINIRLKRQLFTSMLSIFPNPPVVSRGNTVVDSFSTTGDPGNTIVSGADNLEELTGTPFTGFVSFDNPTRFHTIEVDLDNGADASHVLCGVKIDYQVAASSADPGTVFHPLDSFRAFDSRQAAFGTLSGQLAPSATKVIDITDGYDSSGVAIPAQDNLVPTNATAITYNITVAGPTGSNFVAVTAGDAASFTASAINYAQGTNVANGAAVSIDAAQTIKLWGGDGPGSAHVIIDVTGFYAPAPPPPNMGN